MRPGKRPTPAKGSKKTRPSTTPSLKGTRATSSPSPSQRPSPPTRVNFLSYSYVLYRCFEILQQPHMLEGLSLLKGRDKLEANDAIFRKMAHDLGWPVADLPPASVTTVR